MNTAFANDLHAPGHHTASVFRVIRVDKLRKHLLLKTYFLPALQRKAYFNNVSACHGKERRCKQRMPQCQNDMTGRERNRNSNKDKLALHVNNRGYC